MVPDASAQSKPPPQHGSVPVGGLLAVDAKGGGRAKDYGGHDRPPDGATRDRLDRTEAELEAERRRTASLYSAFLPPSTARQILNGQQPDAGQWPDIPRDAHALGGHRPNADGDSSAGAIWSCTGPVFSYALVCATPMLGDRPSFVHCSRSPVRATCTI